MPSMSAADGAKLQALAGGRLEMPSPGTLQRLEDPRAWHARGEVGIHTARRPSAGTRAVALPMAPPLPKGRPVPVKKTVLEEEEYVERLGEIIEGDYFPQNAKMTRVLAGLAGHGSGNTPSHIAATPSSVIGAPTPGGSTPGRGGGGAPGTTGDRISSKEAGTGGALTKFVARHTSEDNQAFAELQVRVGSRISQELCFDRVRLGGVNVGRCLQPRADSSAGSHSWRVSDFGFHTGTWCRLFTLFMSTFVLCRTKTRRRFGGAIFGLTIPHRTGRGTTPLPPSC